MPINAPAFSLRACRRLHSRKERRQSGRFLVEGIRPVRAAITSSVAIEVVLFVPELLRSDYGQETVDMARARRIRCMPLSAQEFASISTRKNPHGIACVGQQSWVSLDHIAGPDARVTALYAPQDPGNLGTILRSCDAAGCASVILIGDAVDPWHPAALRAAMGATFSIRLTQCDVASFVTWAANQHLPIVGTSDRAQIDYATITYPGKFVLLMGSERQGLPAELEEIATTMVRIPMAGHADSLNLAVATSLVLYEARNQRQREPDNRALASRSCQPGRSNRART